jgi:CO/xanthine dehydrogenase Mo-binding subunit
MIPPALAANPRLDRWIRFDAAGEVTVAFGKTENGQGVMTALAQMAADELDVDFARVRWPEPSTATLPDEGRTVGSMSIETSGSALRAVCAEVRALALEAAAGRLGCEASELDVRDGAVLRGGRPTGEDYWTLGLDLDRAPTGEAPWKAPDRLRIVGVSAPRVDLAPKVFGAAFLHDLVLPGMRHARILRQPGPEARFAGLDEAAVRRAVPDVDILADHDFVAVIAATEAQASRAYDAAAAVIRWDGVREVSPSFSEPAALKDLPAETFTAGAEVAEPANRRRHTAAYGRPFISHGSIGPSVGVAQHEGGRMTVWAHNQGVYPLADMVMRATGLPLDNIEVRHASGAGNYGHNGSDDAAVDAALIAQRRPGAPIRVQWRREDEFGWSPVGAAMHIELSGELDAAGRLVDFTTEIWNPPHTNRGVALSASALPKIENLPPPRPQGPALPPGVRFSGGLLNATPSYDIAAMRTVEHVIKPPVRTSSLRGLGGPPNIYAGESFVDELAEIAGEDPLAYRLSMLSDPRARAVLERVGEMCGWSRRWATGTGRGLGIAYDRHRDRGAYCAIAAELEVDADVRLVKLWCACDGGLIVNPDGAKNQLEGGMVMAASWTLKEQVKLGGAGIESVTWADYPILTFSEVPPIEIELLNTRDKRPFGLGEISQGGTMAAIANAVAHALGARLRELPLTRERIAAQLSRA